MDGTLEFEGTEYGVVPEGFRVMPQPVCERYIIAQMTAIPQLGPSIVENGIDPDSLIGQRINSESEQMAIQFEISEAVYNAFDPDFATDEALDKTLRLVGAKRDAGNFTTVEVLLEGDESTVVDAGSIVSVPGGAKFIILEETVIAVGGTLTGAEASERGPVKVLAGQISIIETPIVGWSSVSNPEDGIIGRDKELNSEARVRRREHVSAGGSGRVEAIRAGVLNVTGVLSATVYENDTDEVNARGQAARSIEVVVQGGADEDIAQALWDNKPGATPYVGNIASDMTDSQGFTHTMRFTRISFIEVYVTYELTTNDDFPVDGEAIIENNTITRGDALEIGEDVIVDPFLKGNISDVDGIENSIIKVGTAPAPTLSDNIVISDTEKADFDTSRIVFVYL